MSKHTQHTTIEIEDIHKEIAERLSVEGKKYTKSRRKLVEALAKESAPVTLPEIVGSTEGLSFSSTYRNLDVLSGCKAVSKIISEEHNYFELAEPFKHHHHHLICMNCGSVVDIHLDLATEKTIDDNLAEKAKKANFKPVKHTLDLYGYCAKCA